jgi:hypothetical protein
MNEYRRPTKPFPVDDIVAKFTRDLLGEARKQDVPFAYAGNKGNRADEINHVMNINTDVVRDLLKKNGQKST